MLNTEDVPEVAMSLFGRGCGGSGFASADLFLASYGLPLFFQLADRIGEGVDAIPEVFDSICDSSPWVGSCLRGSRWR